MAGLLDIFGTGGADTMGLLGMSAEDIARNRDDAQAQALYALAGRLFQGGNTGQSIAEGLQLGQKAYRGGMSEAMQGQLQNVQLADMLRKRKLEQQQLAEQQRIQGVIQGAVTKPQEIYGEDIMGQRVGEGMTAPRFDLQRAMPQLVGSAEGRKTLAELVASEKAMRPDTFSLAEGATQFERDQFTGETKAVATGAPKVAKLTGKEGNVALMFFGTDDVAKLRGIPNAIDKIRLEATIQRKAEQPQLNINDPTAVEAQKLKTLAQWENALKDSGATETAMRAQGFYAAYEQAKKGNSNADGALIYNVAKVYDPAGAVQAGDVSTVIGVPSMPETIKKAAQKLTTGGSLTPKERENMKKIIDDVVDERKRMVEPSLNTYRKINRGLGGTDDLIVNPYDSVKKPASLESILGFDRPRGGQ
jgi:hypothetical protein